MRLPHRQWLGNDDSSGSDQGNQIIIFADNAITIFDEIGEKIENWLPTCGLPRPPSPVIKRVII
jgi:hypothetical protein